MSEKHEISAEEALQRLKDGNERFLQGEAHLPSLSHGTLTELARGQHPFATILGCSDSRVPKGVNVVLVSTSSGIAPFLSMLSTHLRFPSERKVALIHGVRYSWDLGYRSVLMAMEHLRTNFTYIPVVSLPKEEHVPWKGATGLVQDVWKSGALEKAWGFRPGPENTHVFLCGNPRMSESMIELLGQEGFKEDRKGEPGQIHVEKYWQ